MQLIAQITFIACFSAAVWFFSKKIREIRRNILLGLPEDLTDQPTKRWKNLLLLAFGQKKMFANPTVAILHLFVYVGFVVINIEVVEILLDGITGRHRLFLEPLGSLYTVLINSFEILAALVLIACVIFMIRRNMQRIQRFMSKDLDGWPRSDANYILITEIVLMSLFLIMNATDLQLQQLDPTHYSKTDPFIISSLISPLLNGLPAQSLVIIERSAWWLHILGIFAFLNYLPWSKHLHILLAFPNAWYARLTSPGSIQNMPSIQKEVLYMMQPELAPSEPSTTPQKFGAKDVMDLSWKSLLDAYSCTECGRCSAACPANSTGKLLSPRKIMMSTRDRLEEVGRNIDKNGQFSDDGKTLLNDYITVEELRACTTCNACVEACPVSINPLSIITELRRSLIMEDSNAPGEWNAMFSNIENNFAPWKFSPDERDAWTQQVEKV
jgi:heterodisulfide reductase subunit C